MNDDTLIAAPLLPTPAERASTRFSIQVARSQDEVRETQRLRYRIFAGELGAKIDDHGSGLDRDGYDRYCRHLYVRDTATGAVVACTRVLADENAMLAGGFYSGGEFDLGLLDSLPGRALEVGRTCVDPEYRNGSVIAVLWSGIAAMVANEKFSYLFGCASISLDDGGAAAHSIIQALQRDYLSPPYHRVRPRRPLPPADAAPAGPARMPPLLKAYVALGAKACGEAYYDEEFNCADVFMLLNVDELHPRYARRFFGRDHAATAGAALA